MQVPEDWVPGRIGKGEIGLENAVGPLLEAKWSVSRPRKTLDQAVREIRRRLPSSARFETRSAQVWPFAVDSPQGFDVVYFGRTDKLNVQELGAVLCCRRCGRIVIVQSRLLADFYKQFAQVFSSLTDLCTEKRVDWMVYDIRIRLAPAWALSSSSFAPGRFDIEFVRGHDTLRLYRFAPADVLLRRFSFEQLVQEGVVAAFSGRLQVMSEDEENCIWVDTIRPQGLGGALYDLMAKTSRRPYRVAQFWHVATANKLLGILLSSRHVVTRDDLNPFVSAYATF
ncbi:hypothetical protein [Desulfovibrio inopinatus]|uniref:hypothetical protein n=1 Tax=Desulfovibrio inopinatus TaxID=102109 RepID=UPI000417E5E9|nr:hypothetical protein [Desulfovibrio inopinatus]